MPQSATPQAEMEAAADRTGDRSQEVSWGVWTQHPHKGQGPCLAQVGSSGGCGQAWAASAPGTSELWWPPSRRRAAVSSVQGMTSSPTPAAGCVQWELPGAPSPSPSCSVCTNRSSPPAMGTEPAAPTALSTGPPIAGALGRPLPGCNSPAALAGRGPVGSLGPAEQQYASHRVGTEGAVSIQAIATALQGGRVTPARQMWTSAALEEPAVPSAVSTLQAATGASAGRGTAHLQMAHSVCPREGPPGWPQVPQQEWTAW
ncbi:epidermal growth factor-like protein 7 isoform 8-T9 [Callospermophilus lateralis]|uniref:epidermal growth factor-like protein 7 isoform X8 n=1 Tax=Callospermophilus lateralis TaxID=76772 RepID=UPI004053C61B